jgi:hypothetical protein
MESIKIDILNPKALKIIKELADLDLIKIKSENTESNFLNILKKLRSKSNETPSLSEITKEVETVRKARYEKNNP